jgi:hypothetical protein
MDPVTAALQLANTITSLIAKDQELLASYADPDLTKKFMNNRMELLVRMQDMLLRIIPKVGE